MSPKHLARRIKALTVRLTITINFEQKLHEAGGWHRDRTWYKSQTAQWLGWLSEYNGAGFLGRQNFRVLGRVRV